MSLDSYKKSFIVNFGGGKKIISVIVVWLIGLLHEEFLPIKVFFSPLEVFSLHEGDEGDDDNL